MVTMLIYPLVSLAGALLWLTCYMLRNHLMGIHSYCDETTRTLTKIDAKDLNTVVTDVKALEACRQMRDCRITHLGTMHLIARGAEIIHKRRDCTPIKHLDELNHAD